jgi:DNA-binding GntR family transcriptional regulator
LDFLPVFWYISLRGDNVHKAAARNPKSDASLSEVAYERIREGIISGDIALGAPLTRRRLSEIFQMSLVPVAEALKRLETEGLVESLPRVGTRVKVPTADEIRGHYILREALEVQVARLFVLHATAAQRRDLKRDGGRLDNAFLHYFRLEDERKSMDVHRQHLLFHSQLARSVKCEVLFQQIQNSQVLLFNWRYTLFKPEPLPADWHGQLAEILARGTVVEADQAMRRHVTYRMEEVIDRFETVLKRKSLQNLGYRGPQRRTLERDGQQAIAEGELCGS